ncbi:hypothetical protein [Merismopedia glauca]|uniref:hypothetical protein n=1 Tax=Merismopedia glauca TaxID=292586 RepID=UPI0015E78EBC|nr:hypothetical protein [Merismopedia glauca]
MINNFQKQEAIANGAEIKMAIAVQGNMPKAIDKMVTRKMGRSLHLQLTKVSIHSLRC